MLASAYDAEIDGIYYYLYQWLEDGPQASVTYRDYDGNSYSGAVTIPESVTYEGMTYSVTSISSSAFSNCSALNSVTIPKTVVKVTADAFSGCPALTTIMVEQGNPQYDSRDACNAVLDTGTHPLVAGCAPPEQRDIHWCLCLCPLQYDDFHYYTGECHFHR